MKKNLKKLLVTFVMLIFSVGANAKVNKTPISIQEQGRFTVGGKVKTSEGTYTPIPKSIADRKGGAFWDAYNASIEAGGQTLHGDHASVFYQIPVKAKKNPLVFLHGYGGGVQTWQTTPDGREGFDTIFLRKGYSIYLIDQPRQGSASKTTEKYEIKAVPDEQFWYAQFRIGVYPNMNKGVAFPADKESQEQFFRSMTTSTGAFDLNLITDSMVKLFEKIGKGIFITHSAGGAVGWMTAIKSDKVTAVVSYEPGAFPFPEGEVPEKIESRFGDVAPMVVSKEDFKKLTKIPIIIYFGDFIPEQLDGTQGGEQWYIRMKLAQQFVETVNKYRGKAELVHLPKVGIKGNTHFIFSDLNNQQYPQPIKISIYSQLLFS